MPSQKRKPRDAAPSAKPAPDWSRPTAVDGPSMVFGGSMEQLMPAYKDLPEEFTRQRSPWVDWQSSWFFKGLSRWPVPKDGIDVNAAMRHLSAIQNSWEPKHEHKMAGVAYLASLWFSSPDGEDMKRKEPVPS